MIPLRRWSLLVGGLVILGCLQVSQRNAIFLKGYDVGKRVSRLHAGETDVAWLSAQVAGLSSPRHLAEIAERRQLKLVAWSRLSQAGGAAQGQALSRHERGAHPAGALAQAAPAELQADLGETAD